MEKVSHLINPQVDPTKNSQPAVWSLVIDDMVARDVFGESKYGTRLQPFNGRDALVDAYQEALDLVVYLRTAIYERDAESQKVSGQLPVRDDCGDPKKGKEILPDSVPKSSYEPGVLGTF
jgi:hypothetical protein